MTSQRLFKLCLCVLMLTFVVRPCFSAEPAAKPNLTRLKSELNATTAPLTQVLITAQEEAETQQNDRNNTEQNFLSEHMHLMELFIKAVDSLLLLDGNDPKAQKKAQEAATYIAQVSMLLPETLAEPLNDHEQRKFISPAVREIAKNLNSQLSQAVKSAQQSLKQNFPSLDLEETSLENPYTRAVALIADKYDMQPPFDSGYFNQMKDQLKVIAQQTQQALNQIKIDFEKEKSTFSDTESKMIQIQIAYYGHFIQALHDFISLQKTDPLFQAQAQMLTTFLSDFRFTIPVHLAEQLSSKAYENLLSGKVRESVEELSLFLLEKCSQAHLEIAKGVKGVDLRRTSLADIYASAVPKSDAKPPEYKRANYMQLMKALNTADEIGKPTSISLRSLSSPGYFQFQGMTGRQQTEAHHIAVSFNQYFQDPATGRFALNPNSISIGVFSAPNSKFEGRGTSVSAEYTYKTAPDSPDEKTHFEFFKNGRIAENTFLSREAYGHYQSVGYAKGVLTIVSSQRYGNGLKGSRAVQIAKVEVDPEFKHIGSVSFENYEELFVNKVSVGLRARGKFHNLNPLQLMLKDFYPKTYGSPLGSRTKTADDLEFSEIENIANRASNTEKTPMILDANILQKLGLRVPTAKACWKAHGGH